MIAPVRVTPPATTPVSLAEAKLHCHVDHDDDDSLITTLIAAATEHLDGWAGLLGRAMVTQSWRQDFCRFGCLRLPLPAASITSITYHDANGDQQTLSTDIYDLFADARGSFVDLKPDQSWPGTQTRHDAVSVTFVAGSGAADVPAPLKAAVLMLTAHLYLHREAVGDGTLAALPLGVASLIAPYRRVGV